MKQHEAFSIINEAKKADMSYFSPDDLIPAPENNLLYEGFNPWADDDDNALFCSIKAEGIRSRSMNLMHKSLQHSSYTSLTTTP